MKRHALILLLSFSLLLCLSVGCSTAKIPISEAVGVVSGNVSGGLKDDPLKIWLLRPLSPNSVGGVNVEAMFKNQSDKAIKYLRITVTPYNAVMDPVSCQITGKSTARLQDVGPWVSGGVDYGLWETVWYNSTIKYISLDSIEIEYMDGTIVRIP